MVPRKPALLKSGKARWQPLADGGWLFEGQDFEDGRGPAFELFDLAGAPDAVASFAVAQENLISTRERGCGRGLHYQLPPYRQAKLVSVVTGDAQFFWLDLDGQRPGRPKVHSLVLCAGSRSLFTPSSCAHGFVAISPDTVFLMKMSAPVMPDFRGEISFSAEDIDIEFEVAPERRLLSPRDKSAPTWGHRRV